MSALSFQWPLCHNYTLFFYLYLSHVYLMSSSLLPPHILLCDVESLLPVNVQ